MVPFALAVVLSAAPVPEAPLTESEIRSSLADLRRRSPSWHNVTAYGARGDGATDDTRAIRAALSAASTKPLSRTDWGQGGGGTVYFPRGIYRMTDTLLVNSDGIQLEGEGPGVSTISCVLRDASKDCIHVGDASSPGSRIGVRGLTVEDAATGTSRDILHLDGSTWPRVENVALFGGGRTCLWIGGTIDGALDNVRMKSCGVGLRIGTDSRGVEATTLHAKAVYSAYNRNQGVIVDGAVSILFDRLIAEFNGRLEDPANGQGILVRGEPRLPPGVTFIQPYTQSNSGWDIHIGASPEIPTYAVIVNPFMVLGGGNRKQKGHGLMLIDHVISGALIGGTLNFVTPGLRFTARAQGFSVLGTAFLPSAPPEYDPGNGHTIADYRGVVVGYNGTDYELMSRATLRVGGGTPILGHLSAAEPWEPCGAAPCPPGEMRSTSVNVRGAAPGDTAVCAHSGVRRAGVTLFGTVVSTDKVAVTLKNESGTSQPIPAGLLRCDVWKH